MLSSNSLSFLFLIIIRILLYSSCRLALPLLFNEARQFSFDAPTSDSEDESIPLEDRLPTPSTSSVSSSKPDSSSLFGKLFSAPGSSSTNHYRKLSTANPTGSTSSSNTKAEWIRAASALLFSISFEESAFLFVLVLLEAAGFDHGLLKANWNFSLVAVIALGVFWIPLGMCLLFTLRSGFTSSKTNANNLSPSSSRSTLSRLSNLPKAVAPYLLWSLLPFLIWIFIFLKVPLPSAILNPSSINEPQEAKDVIGETGGLAHIPDSVEATKTIKNDQVGVESGFGFLLSRALTREAVLGVTLIALLSGSGAMSAAWDTWESWFSKKSTSVSASQLQSANAAYQRTLKDLSTKKLQLEHLRNSPDTEAKPSGISGTLGNLWSGSKKSREIKSIEQELFGLTTLVSVMREDLQVMRDQKRMNDWSKTFKGRILIVLTQFFSVYCVFRIILAVLNLLIFGYSSPNSDRDGNNQSTDFIAYSLALLLKFFNLNLNVDAWTKQISLLFVGFLILGRLRIVLSNLSHFFKAASHGVGTSALILFLAEVLSVYLLATLIQLRTSLPTSFSLSDPSSNLSKLMESTSNPTSNPLNKGQGSIPSLSTQPDFASSSSQPQPQPSSSLLSTLPPFQTVFGSIFDSAFLLAAFLTWLLRFFNRRFQGDTTMLGNRD